jgi:hypothetical protein
MANMAGNPHVTGRYDENPANDTRRIFLSDVYELPTEGDARLRPRSNESGTARFPRDAPAYDREYDRAKPWTQFPMGYPRFAAFIANDEDKSTMTFRRFQRLSARNLLYLESELADLEEEQDRLDDISKQDDDLRLSMKSWNLLCLQATPPAEEPAKEGKEEKRRRLQVQEAAQERLHLAWRTREVLKTYR